MIDINLPSMRSCPGWMSRSITELVTVLITGAGGQAHKDKDEDNSGPETALGFSRRARDSLGEGGYWV